MGHDLKEDVPSVLRNISEAERKRIYHISKGVLQGMVTGKTHHGFDYVDFLPRFKKGEFDTTLENAPVLQPWAGTGLG